MIAVDLNKQQALDADPKAVHKISFNKNLEQAENATMFFIHEEVRETVLHFSQGAMRVLWIDFALTYYNSINVKIIKFPT